MRRSRKMGGFSTNDPRLTNNHHHNNHHSRRHGPAVEEIEGLIRVYKDGHVDRLPIVRDVSSTSCPESGVGSTDIIFDTRLRLWARIYAPKCQPSSSSVLTTTTAKLPVMVYFHGGGFCVASAAWSCYHEFLSRLAGEIGGVIVSVNYRLAPEHRLPAAYDDGVNAVKWVRQQGGRGRDEANFWWSTRCDFSRLFLAGDSAGGTIALNVAPHFPGVLAGVMLIQPFLGGEERTSSEKNLTQPPTSALSLAVSDTYWRLALPSGSTRDHHWCNPLTSRWLTWSSLPDFLLCVSELDILRDRNVEFCRVLRSAGKTVEMVVHGGVGHAFHVLSGSRLAQRRTQEMMDQIKKFMSSR